MLWPALHAGERVPPDVGDLQPDGRSVAHDVGKLKAIMSNLSFLASPSVGSLTAAVRCPFLSIRWRQFEDRRSAADALRIDQRSAADALRRLPWATNTYISAVKWPGDNLGDMSTHMVSEIAPLN